MSTQIDFKKMNKIVCENKLFDVTYDSLVICLKNWWLENEAVFLEDMGNDLETVLKKYKFENEGFSFSKSYLYTPPIYYISILISIYDEEGSYITQYTAFYDTKLKAFDDRIG